MVAIRMATKTDIDSIVRVINAAFRVACPRQPQNQVFARYSR